MPRNRTHRAAAAQRQRQGQVFCCRRALGGMARNRISVTAPLRHIVPLDRRGHRRPETLAALHCRDALIREVVAVFFPRLSANDAAHRLHTALQRYESGAWRRERIADA
jgi:hypothetical protein